jgi:hypothetical protein
MWKYGIEKNSAIELIKSKRKCVEINLGFMLQLGKWEDFLMRRSYGTKFYNFGGEGEISLIEKEEFENFKSSDFDKHKFSISLLLIGDKFLKVIFNTDKNLEEKVEKFILLLQTYEKFPSQYISLNIDKELLNKEFFQIHIEEIAKCS